MALERTMDLFVDLLVNTKNIEHAIISAQLWSISIGG